MEELPPWRGGNPEDGMDAYPRNKSRVPLAPPRRRARRARLKRLPWRPQELNGGLQDRDGGARRPALPPRRRCARLPCVSLVFMAFTQLVAISRVWIWAWNLLRSSFARDGASLGGLVLWLGAVCMAFTQRVATGSVSIWAWNLLRGFFARDGSERLNRCARDAWSRPRTDKPSGMRGPAQRRRTGREWDARAAVTAARAHDFRAGRRNRCRHQVAHAGRQKGAGVRGVCRGALHSRRPHVLGLEI